MNYEVLRAQADDDSAAAAGLDGGGAAADAEDAGDFSALDYGEETEKCDHSSYQLNDTMNSGKMIQKTDR